MQLGTTQGMFVRLCGDKGPGLKPPVFMGSYYRAG
jgi:hypothetical protein